VLRLLTRAVLLVVPLQAHDIVSTAVTWDRDISRIVYARCASCHHPGGTAFSLMTYQSARPWAAAIKEAVLSRQMPPWGAVKGFGEFRNDQALTSEQLELVTAWAEGGTPEGDPKDLPPAPKSWQNPRLPDLRGASPVSGRVKLMHALILDGLLPQNVPPHASIKILAQLPDGSLLPLLWLQNYDTRYQHAFLLRNRISLPPLTVIHGVPEGASIMLIPADSNPR
jgi:hypothetical protein